MGVTHLPLNFRFGDHGRDGVHNNDVNGLCAHQGLGDFHGLFAGIRLGYQQIVDINAQSLGVYRVQGVLHIDKGGLSPCLLGLRHHMEGDGGLAGGLRPEYLDDSAPGQSAHPQGHVQGQGAGGDAGHVHLHGFAQAHDGTLAKLFFDLQNGVLNRNVLICFFFRVLYNGGFFGLFCCHIAVSCLFLSFLRRGPGGGKR